MFLGDVTAKFLPDGVAEELPLFRLRGVLLGGDAATTGDADGKNVNHREKETTAAATIT